MYRIIMRLESCFLGGAPVVFARKTHRAERGCYRSLIKRARFMPPASLPVDSFQDSTSNSPAEFGAGETLCSARGGRTSEMGEKDGEGLRATAPMGRGVALTNMLSGETQIVGCNCWRREMASDKAKSKVNTAPRVLVQTPSPVRSSNSQDMDYFV